MSLVHEHTESHRSRYTQRRDVDLRIVCVQVRHHVENARNVYWLENGDGGELSCTLAVAEIAN